MKTVFIINPKAGKGKGTDQLIKNISDEADRQETEIEIYLTKGVGDAEQYARCCCEGYQSDTLRLIACGGDGTLNEVLNGAVGHDHAVVGIVPIGTGNDFCRNFPKAGDFRNIEAQLRGSVTDCDAICYSGLLNGIEQRRYCANMFNIGFDCNVVDLTARLKKYPLISGSFAYLLAVLLILIRKKGADLTIELDGEVCQNGRLLLTALANGSCCGGGLRSAPHASVHDGWMDVNIIYDVSRWNFLKKFPYYAKGTHMDLPDIQKVLLSKRCRKALITPRTGKMRLCTDGELSDAGCITFEVVPHAFHLLLPAVL